MNKEISLTFKKCKNEKRPALLTYIVAGDYNKKKSSQILNSISEHADIIEYGMPLTQQQQMVHKYKIAPIEL